MPLHVVSFYEDLERQFGLDAVRLKPDSSTAAIKLVAKDGGPLSVGWFENAGKRGAPPGGLNHYALTSVPHNARTIHHRVMLEQTRAQMGSAVLKEENCFGFLEGDDDYPDVLDYRSIGQPVLAELIKEITDNAMVLSVERADEYAAMSRELAIDGLREYGLSLRAQQIGLGFVSL